MASLIQRSFAGGEIAPAVYGRADQIKYQTGLRTCRNFLVRRHGGVSNRPGSKFITEQRVSTSKGRLIKFVFNASQTYILLFENQTMRVVREGALVLVSGVAAWSGATNYVVGDLVVSAGINYYCILAHINQIPPNATYWYPLPGNIYEIPTPYVTADLPTLYAVQSGDVITLTHKSYQPRNLARTAHTTWVFSIIVTEPAIARPTAVLAVRGAAGTFLFRYKVTAIAADTFEESLPGRETAFNITAITQANPGVVTTSAPHGFNNGDEVFITGVVGMTPLNDRVFIVQGVAASTFQLEGENTTGYPAYISGGTVARTAAVTLIATVPTQAAPNVVTWNKVTNAIEYNVYREDPIGSGFFGFLGVSRESGPTPKFEDPNVAPDASFSPPEERKLFTSAGNFPAVAGYFQQRRLYGDTDNDPESIFGSKTGSFNNFGISSPLQDGDAVTFAVAGRQVQEIRHLMDVGNFVIMTAGGEWVSLGDANGILTPTSPNLKQHSYYGSAQLAPVVIGNNLLYVQARGSSVRDLRYEFATNGYAGNDLTVFAAHLFDGFTVIQWDYSQIPHSIVWAVRSDGGLLGLTYLREHDIWGWHRHDTDGLYEDVCVVPEGVEDAIYVLVNRTILATTKRYLERFASRRVTDITIDAYFADSFLTYDGRNSVLAPSTTMFLSGGTTWGVTETLVLTASAAFFTVGDVGNAIVLTVGADTLKVNITAFVSTTQVSVMPSKTVPVTFRNVTIAVWSRAVDDLSGLGHLEGKVVAVLGDGHVVTNGVDAPLLTVSGGALPTLSATYSVIHVGLPIQFPDFELLDLEVQGQETITDKRKLVTSVTVLIEESRGFWAGPDATNLKEFKQRTAADNEAAIPPLTGQAEVSVRSTWNTTGRVMIRQRDPLPLTILSVTPQGDIGG